MSSEERYRADVDEGREKFYLTAAFPYPNSPQHIGHARTYTITDVYARFKRHQGKNVLFPMGFHVTGTPILAMAERIKEGDESLLKIFEDIYGIPRDKALALTDPRELVLYFSKEIEEGMKELGLSIDWRRKFYTFDPHFQKFIEWQFRKLKEKGYLKKGSHYIAWSRKLRSAHDTKGDVDPEIEEMHVLLLPLVGSDSYVAVATYRPETLYGMTNVWYAPEGRYALYEVKGKKVVLSREAADILKDQLELREVEDVTLEGREVENPLTGEKVPLLPSKLVDAKAGTGVVMSVPAHSVADYLGYMESPLREKPIPSIIEVEGYGQLPAKEVAELFKATLEDEKALKEATKKLYKDELAKGVMKVDPLKGVPVREARDRVREDMESRGLAFSIYVIANAPVYTRAGDEVVVKRVDDQWFIDYGNEEWKALAKKAVERMRFVPEKVRKEILATIDWLKEKACTRSRGLGTPFPFDRSQVIESLSDSTVYMAFYPLMPDILSFSPEELTEEFFDYIFYGKGELKNEVHERLRKSFLYWYPLDSRHSGADLVRNHLTFFIMNHVALFPEEHWPKQIVVNGFVLMEGKKMSKSLGNILPLRKAIREFGADVIRFSVVSGAELDQDTDFSRAVAEGIKARLAFFKELTEKLGGKKELADEWIEALFKKKLTHLEELFEDFQLREIALRFFYNFYNELQLYMKMREPPYALEELFEDWLTIMHPFMPFFAEEMAERMGVENIERRPMPKAEEYDEELVELFRIALAVKEDIKHIIELGEKKGNRVERVQIHIPPEEAFQLYSRIASSRSPKELMAWAKEQGLVEVAKKYIKRIHKIEAPVSRERWREVFTYLKPFFEKELGIEVEVLEGREGMPDKPKITYG